MLHRVRELLVRQRTMAINAPRGHCAGNYDLMAKQGVPRIGQTRGKIPSIKLATLTGRRSNGFFARQRSAYRTERPEP